MNSYNIFFHLIVCLNLLGCATATTQTPKESLTQKFETISLGDSAQVIESKFGKASENLEKFNGKTFSVLEYCDAKGIPEISFSLDPQTKKVAGKTIWLTDRLKNTKDKWNSDIEGLTFQKFIPCETRTPTDEININVDKGIFLFKRAGELLMISWADPTLTKLRIDQFQLKCPHLQQ